MNCAWDAYLNLLPPWIRSFVDQYGRTTLQELRLRYGSPPQLIMGTRFVSMDRPVTTEDISYCINAASQYSPWSAATSSQGYITAAGGHRIGICGLVTVRDGTITGISQPHYLCLRVARDFCGIADRVFNLNGSVLLIGPPGSGKTTFLRDLIRQRSYKKQGSVAVVDERGELFPIHKCGSIFDAGPCTDILTGCSKESGIEMVLRTMGPSTIAVDEITAPADCRALIYAGRCGVQLLATAHAYNVDDLFCRPIYKVLTEKKLFDHIIVLQTDKSWRLERMRFVQ